MYFPENLLHGGEKKNPKHSSSLLDPMGKEGDARQRFQLAKPRPEPQQPRKKMQHSLSATPKVTSSPLTLLLER